jgi:hypothetical protein
MPVMPDTAILAACSHDQADPTAREWLAENATYIFREKSQTRRKTILRLH